jgi:serine/threonine protein kinase/Tol biopolymer transport system component
VSAARLRLIESLYHAARERAPGERAAFLTGACGGDDALRDEVTSLLAADDAAYSGLKTAGAWPRASLIGQRLGAYEIVSALGAGGMGEVYRASDTKLNRQVAIKVLPATFAGDRDRVARFTREAQTLASLNHPNIAQIYGIETFSVQGSKFSGQALVMELVDGKDLSDVIARGPLALPDALSIAKQIADALEAAHELGIVHRDLKPANIKVRADGTVKVLDFGLAKALAPALSSGALEGMSSPTVTGPPMTETGMILGTAPYMSPEQAKGSAVDQRSDVWAFGCVSFEMLTGSGLFRRATVAETLAAVLTDPIDWSQLPLDTPDQTRRLLRRCLQRGAADRLRYMGSARLELQEVLEELRHAPTAVGGLAGASPNVIASRRFSWRIAISAAAILALGVVGASLWRRAPAVTPVVTRLSVFPTPRMAFGESAPEPYPSVSPGGERVAFVGHTPNARGQLFVQSLEEFQPRPISGAVAAQWPFWSPDGRYLAYFAEGQLRIVLAAGGPARSVGMVAAGFGGAWNADGTIVFGSDAGMMRIPVAGGTPTRAFPQTAASQALSQRFPVFLPDGDHFLFAQLSRDGEPGGIYVASLRDATSKRLIDVVSNPIFVEQGYILYVRDNTLFASRFDPLTLTVSGDPLTVDTPLEGGGTIRYAPISASGNTLAYRPANYATSQLVVMDRAGVPVQSVGPEGVYLSPSISPDGDRLAFTRVDLTTGSFGIWEMSVSRNTGSRLNSGRTLEFQPVWSPDGQRLVYSAARSGTFSIFERNFLTGKERSVLQLAARLFPSGWQPGGDGILYTEERGAGPEGDVWEYAFDGSEPKPLIRTAADETHGRISPDGRWLAYSSDDSGRWEVYITPRGGGRRVVISNAGGTNPLWRKDSRELYYVEYDERSRSSLAIDAVLKAVQLDGVGGRPQPVTLFRVRVPTFSLYEVWVYSALPTGQRFVFNRVTDESQSGLNITRHWTPPQR